MEDASVNQAIEDLRKKLEEFANPSAVRSGESLELDVLKKVEELFDDLQEVDAGPTPQQEIALGNLQRDARSVLSDGKRYRRRSRQRMRNSKLAASNRSKSRRRFWPNDASS